MLRPKTTVSTVGQIWAVFYGVLRNGQDEEDERAGDMNDSSMKVWLGQQR